MNKYISAALMAAGLQGCLDDSHTGDSGTPTAYPQILFAAQEGSKVRYVLYHPGFTRSGAEGHPSPLIRNLIKLLGTFFARPVADSVRPINDWIDHPPARPLSAIDRGKPVDPSLKTLDPGDAARLAAYTESLLRDRDDSAPVASDSAP